MATKGRASKHLRVADVGFHVGELTVQARAGVQAQAARLRHMLDPADLRGAAVAFLADQSFAAMTARDHAGRLWISPVVGDPGFLSVTSPASLTIRAALPIGDPLHECPADQPVGLVAIDFDGRRRVRVNGMLVRVRETELVLAVEQAYGNCPKYIHRRAPSADRSIAASSADVRRDIKLAPADVRLVESADTFFLGTTNPERGNDASHRGGTAGFVRVDGGDLWWPDYTGNNIFNSLGNLAVDPAAALLVIDFSTGQTLQLSGTAVIEWTAARTNADETGRRVRFTPQHVVARISRPVR